MTLEGVFNMPFAAQVAAFRLRLRNLVGTAKWTDLWQAEHDRAFMVAGAMKADLLADLAAAVEKAIAAGGTLEQFRADFRSIVAKHGWHGWTGEGTKAGEAWRTRVIYRTNMATSYAAGRWAQITDAKFPYVIYFHGNSREPRLQHLAWDGLVLPADHPFWATHAPPNGWGCSCYVSGARSLTAARILGGDPDKALPDGWQAIDGRTGAPKGIDRGWAYAPGASAADEIARLAREKAEKLPEPVAAALVRTADLSVLPPPPEDLTSWRSVATTGKAVLDRLLRQDFPTPVGELPLFRGLSLGEVLAQGYVEEVAAILRDRSRAALGRAREVGTLGIRTVETRPDGRALMADVARLLPADWVRAGNEMPVRVIVSERRGSYRPGGDGRPPEMRVDRGSALHEYVHHLQFALPDLNRLFLDLHESRTRGDPLVLISESDEVARPDGYYNPYQGREYRGYGAMEVMTMGFDPLLGMDEEHPHAFRKMLTEDREMLEFVLGVLFYWKRG